MVSHEPLMTPRSYPPSDTQRAGGPGTPDTASPASDDRPTAPPPFDVQAFARQTAASNPDLPLPLDPITTRLPLLADPDRESASHSTRPLDDASTLTIADVGASTPDPGPSLAVPVTAPPMTVTMPPPRPTAVRTGRIFAAWAGAAALAIIALGIAGESRRLHIKPGASTVTTPAVAPPLSAPDPVPSPDLPVGFTVVRPAEVPSAQPRAPQACQPPFVIDAAGKKHWKLECL